MNITLKFLTCCLVLLSVSPQQINAHEEHGETDALANNLMNALSEFVEAHSEELPEEVQHELAHVQVEIEQQKNKSEELEHQLHIVAEEAMVSPKCDGVIAGSICYVLHNQKSSFDVADTVCLQKDSMLANIDSEHHYTQVMEYILQHDVFTDRSVVFVWTGLNFGGDSDDDFFSWLPGYPRETSTFNRIIWQIVSSNNYGDHGYLNVPNVASAYPLCQHDLEIGIDDCSPNPCQNNGTCTDGLNSYNCSCVEGFAGVNCETRVLGSSCSSDDDCKNVVANAQCASYETGMICECETGFKTNDESEPTSCHRVIDSSCIADADCALGPNSVCMGDVGNKMCACPAGFRTNDVSTICIRALGSDCLDDAYCTDIVENAACIGALGEKTCGCDSGFEANNVTSPTACDNVDDCSPNPCQNNGTCTDGVNAFNCTCVGGFTGANCEDAPVEKCEKTSGISKRRRRRSVSSNLNYVGFIVDDTGSMASEIAGVRLWLSNCVNSGTNCGSAPSGGWLLQSYNDPTIGTPVGPTTDASVMDAAIGSLTANGGGDCPERAFAGMLSAIDRIPEDNGNCKFFFFSDATDSNPELGAEVTAKMEEKGCSLIAVLTGCCGTCNAPPVGHVYAPGDPLEFLYYDTASVTGGEVYVLPKPSSATAYTSALETTITTLGYCPTNIIVANDDGSCLSKEQCVVNGHCFDESLKVCFQN